MQIITEEMTATSIWLAEHKTNLCYRDKYLPALPKDECLGGLAQLGGRREDKKACTSYM